MSEVGGFDQARSAALEKMEKNERRFRAAFFGAVGFETIFLASFVLLADLSNRTHVLLLVAAVGVYTIVGLGLVALATFIRGNTLRILKAIESLRG
jgi:hypothetical protein